MEILSEVMIYATQQAYMFIFHYLIFHLKNKALFYLRVLVIFTKFKR